jgi:hypothetical protein
MSQFVLFTAKEKNILFSDLKNDIFLQKHAMFLFRVNDVENIYTFSKFDKICMDTQDAIIEGISIYNTKLFKLLELIKDEEIYFWYGSEYDDDLYYINDFDSLISNIGKTLVESSGEIYIHYKTL